MWGGLLFWFGKGYLELIGLFFGFFYFTGNFFRVFFRFVSRFYVNILDIKDGGVKSMDLSLVLNFDFFID